MKDMVKAKKAVDRHNQLLDSFSKEFILTRYAGKRTVKKEIDQAFRPYRHIIKEMPENFYDLAVFQYITCKLFQKNGRINNVINYKDVQNWPEEKLEFLKFQMQHPWQFRFTVIHHRVDESFFIMSDHFTDEEFLLYSPGVEKEFDETRVEFFMLLVSYNGYCYQTNSIIHPYQSLYPSDIFFFATEVNPAKVFEGPADVYEEVEQNPVPFLMLLSGSKYPNVQSRGAATLFHLTETDAPPFDPYKLGIDFTIDFNKNEQVYRIALNEWDKFPHFSVAYYDVLEELLTVTSQTMEGYDHIANALNENNLDVSIDADFIVTPAMMVTAGNILKRDVQLVPYEHLFNPPESKEEKEEVENINAFLSLIIPYINSGQEPDIEALARESDTDPQEAREIYKSVKEKHG